MNVYLCGSAHADCDSLVLNPHGRYYDRLKAAASQGYEDNYWPEDAIFMERNSRDFVTRIDRINKNAEAVCEILLASPIGMFLEWKRTTKRLTMLYSQRCLLSKTQSFKAILRSIPEPRWGLWRPSICDI